MQFKFHLNNLRIAPRKVRSVAALVRGLPVAAAQNELMFRTRRPSGPILKLLKSGIAAAEKNFNLKQDSLYIQNIFVDEGPRLKRFMPRAFGRAAAIHKKTSHITLILSTTSEVKKRKAKKTAVVKKESEFEGARAGREMPKIEKVAPKVLGPKLSAPAALGRRIFRRKSIG